MPNYKLNYFNGRGRAEITRLIFAAAGAKFTDNRVEDWPALKPQAPLGQLPFLEVDDVKLPQSIAIARFAARENNLAGKTNLEQVMKWTNKSHIIDSIFNRFKFIIGSSRCYC